MIIIIIKYICSRFVTMQGYIQHTSVDNV